MSLLFSWEHIIEDFENIMGELTTTFLFEKSCILELVNNTIYIYVDNLVLNIFNDHDSLVYKNLSDLIHLHFSNDLEIVFTNDLNLNVAQNNSHTMTLPTIDSPIPKLDYSSTKLDRSKHFSNYFYSYDNKKIVDVCSLLIDEIENEKPLTFNTLFIHGHSGIGKTHIVNAIGNEIYDLNKNLSILFNNANDFTTAYTQLFRNSLKTNAIEEFKDLYNNLDIFIIDDIQMLQTKEGTLSEFFSIFEKIRQDNKLIIITCDVNPKNLKIEERLLSRFMSGLVLEMRYPDTDTKTQIFQYYAQEMNIEFEEKAIQIFIDNSKNIRELEGYTNAIKADLITNNFEGNIYTVDQALSRVKATSGNFNTITKHEVIKNIASYFKISVEDIKSKKRTAIVVNARNLCIIFLKEQLGLSLEQIGLELGMKGHSNASKVCKRADEIKETLKTQYNDLEQIMTKIKQ